MCNVAEGTFLREASLCAWDGWRGFGSGRGGGTGKALCRKSVSRASMLRFKSREKQRSAASTVVVTLSEVVWEKHDLLTGFHD